MINIPTSLSSAVERTRTFNSIVKSDLRYHCVTTALVIYLSLFPSFFTSFTFPCCLIVIESFPTFSTSAFMALKSCDCSVCSFSLFPITLSPTILTEQFAFVNLNPKVFFGCFGRTTTDGKQFRTRIDMNKSKVLRRTTFLTNSAKMLFCCVHSTLMTFSHVFSIVAGHDSSSACAACDLGLRTFDSIHDNTRKHFIVVFLG